MSVCPLLEILLPGGLDTSAQERTANIGSPIDVFLDRFDDFLCFEYFWGFGVFANQSTVHSVVWELAVGGSVAVAVGVSDR